MFENLKKIIISNGWNFPPLEITRYHALRTDGKTGIVTTKHYGKIYFYIIEPWAMCPAGEIVIERA